MESRTNENFDSAQSDRERIKIIVTSSEPVLSFVEMKANGNSFCTEIHGDFLKWIVMRELEKGKGIFLMEMI